MTKRKGIGNATEPLREDPESQPRKGAKQKGLPVVLDGAKKHPDIEERMVTLSDAMRQYAAAGKVCQDLKREIKTLMISKKVPAYAIDDLYVDVEEGEIELHVKRLKPPKEDAA